MDRHPRRRNNRDDYLDDNPDEDSYFYDDQYETDPDLEENEISPLPVIEMNSPPMTTDDEDAPAEIVIIPKVIAYQPGADDRELDEILHIEEDDEDKHQHYFSDQVHFKRPKWDRWWFGSVSMIAFAVDMSNLVTFPNNVSSLGGATYLVVYAIVLVCFVYPFLYLECIVGQYFQTGMIGIWGISPIFRGLGAGIFYITFVIIAYIPSNILWASILMGDSFASIKTGKLPWSSCENDWNSCRCFQNRIPECIGWKDDNNTKSKAPGVDIVYTPALEYFIGRILEMWKSKYSDPILIKDIRDSGNWSTSYGLNNREEGLGPLIGSSCVIVGIIYLIILFLNWIEMKNLGYWYTFTTAFPTLVMSLLFCRGITLEGALPGLAKYFKPSFGRIFEFQLWYVAFQNAFYSVGCGLGCHIMMSSFNPLNHNVRRDAIICVIVDTSISLLATLVAFMFVGHVYELKREPLPDRFPGDNFVFISLAEAFTAISGSSFFSFVFYFMIIVFCADTQMVTLHALSFSLYEEYKRKYPDQVVSKGIFLYTVWGFAFTITLLSTTRGGYWIFIFLTEHGFGLSAFIFMFLEIVLFAWIWGIDEVCSACITIMGHRPSLYMRITWKYFLPVLILAILIYTNSIKEFEPLRVFDQVAIKSAQGLGLIFQWVAIALMAFYATYIYARVSNKAKGLSCLQMIMLLISPEYEHDSIMEDVKNAKRLTWAHYTFLLYDDEKSDSKIKDTFVDLQRSMTVFKGKIKELFGGKNDEKPGEPDVNGGGGGGRDGGGGGAKGRAADGGGKGGGGGGKGGGVNAAAGSNAPAALDKDVPNKGKKTKKNARTRAEMRREEENAWDMWEKLKHRADVDLEDTITMKDDMDEAPEPVQSSSAQPSTTRQIKSRRMPARGGQRQTATSGGARGGRGGGAMATKSIMKNNKVQPK